MQLGMIGLGRMGGSMARFRSRQDHTCAEKCLSAMRYQFGGHAEG